MKPVNQTSFGTGQGNCFSACIASILEIAVADVPNFCHQDADHDGSTWLERTAAWLQERGWGLVHVTWKGGCDLVLPMNCWLICLGPREGTDEEHAVVGRATAGRRSEGEADGKKVWNWEYSIEWVHDPNPRVRWLTNIEALIALVPGGNPASLFGTE